MAIDFGKEKERIQKEFEESAKYVKLDEGQHRMLFLDNGGEIYTKADWEGKPQCIDFQVEVEGKRKILSVKLESGIYRNLVDYGAKSGGLAGAFLVITREGQMKKTKYSIVEISRAAKPITPEPQDTIGKAAQTAGIPTNG